MRDPRIEQYLAAQSVDYTYVPEVLITDFDLKASLRNQARLTGALNKDTVTEYALAMIDGVDFPAVVTHRPNGLDVLISGNHRIHAAIEAEVQAFDVYRVHTADPFILERLTRSANSIEGMRPSRKESIAQAVYLVENRKMTATAAAKELHLPVQAVRNALNTAKARRRIPEFADALPDTTLQNLGAIQIDRVLQPTAELVAKSKMPAITVDALIAEIRAQSSEDAQLRIVSQWRNRADIKDRVAKYKGGTVAKPQRGADNATRLLTHFGQLANIVAGAKDFSDLNITSPKEQERVKEAWLEAKAAIQSVLR